MTRLAAVLLVLAVPQLARALTVSGHITDNPAVSGAAMPRPIAGIKVEIRDDNFPFPSTLTDTVFTDAAGFYTTSVLAAGDDPFVRVKWEFQLTPAGFYNDHVIRLVDRGTGSPYAAQSTFVEPDGPALSDITTNVTIDYQTSQALPGNALSTVLTRIQQALDFFRLNRGTVAWNPDYDVPVHIKDDNVGVAFFSPGDQAMYINMQEITGAVGTDGPYAIFHEMGHLIHYRMNNALPATACPPCHVIQGETEPGCAFVEGFAEYIGITASEANGINGNARQPLIHDSPPMNWRGSKFMSANPACNYGPLDSGFDNAGEIVEGAIAASLWDYTNPTGVFSSINFSDVLQVLVAGFPKNVFDVRHQIAANSGAGIVTTRLYHVLQRHGIVHGRVRFADTVFDGPSANGAAVPVGDTMFLRGVVTTNFQAMSQGELHVANTVGMSQARLGYRAAPAPGTSESIDPDHVDTTFTFTAPASLGFFSSQIDLDTTTIADGPYDLIVQGENEDGVRDDFDPDWAADQDAMGAATAVNSDERYMKTIGAWFDVDRNPATFADAGGKVVIDNTPPDASITITKTRITVPTTTSSTTSSTTTSTTTTTTSTTTSTTVTTSTTTSTTVTSSTTSSTTTTTTSSTTTTSIVLPFGQPLPDWTTSMLAVWRFEGDFTDATGHGNTLTASASAPTFPSTAGLFVEGAQAVQFAAATTQLASCSAGACPTLSQTSNLTWGCWARSDDVATRTFVHKLSGAGGAGSYMAERVFSAAPTAANTLRCTLSNGAATVTSISAATWTATGGVAPYRFAACVFDDTANTVQSFLNAVGGATAPFPAAMAAQGGPFSVSDATAPWNAQLDECFVDDAAWTPAQLCRAGSCGIDGTLCMCAGALPSTYLACNADSDCRVAGNTTALCNTATHLCTGRNSGGSVDMGGCALPACDAGAP